MYIILIISVVGLCWAQNASEATMGHTPDCVTIHPNNLANIASTHALLF